MWFEYEASFYRSPTVAKAWGCRGRRQPRARSYAGTNARWRMAAGLDPARGRLGYRRHARIDAPLVGQLHAQLADASPDAKRIYLVVDNWLVHHHPNATAPVGQDSRVAVLWLPTCSPLLNPTEKVLRYTSTGKSKSYS